MSEVRKTIREWEQEYGLVIVDLDGFDTSDSQLYQRQYTQLEFEDALASCTVVRRQSAARSANTDTLRDARAVRTIWRRKSSRRLLLLFTLPTLATFLVLALYRTIQRFVAVKWPWPLLVIAIDLLLIVLAPVAPILSGPLYLWYLVLGAITHVAALVAQGLLDLTPWKTAAAGLGSGPFLNSVLLFGNRLPLYFTFGAAVASSLVLGTGISSCAVLWQQLRVGRVSPGTAAPQDDRLAPSQKQKR